MKHIFYIALIFISICAQAQDPVKIPVSYGQTYEQFSAQLMSGLNFSRISTGTLYDKVMGWSNLVQWQRGDTLSFNRIKQAWWDLQHSRLTPGADSYTAMLKSVEQARSLQQIPLISIFAQFNHIDSLAFKTGRMRLENNRLIDSGGISPYRFKIVGLSGLATNEVVAGQTYTITNRLVNIYKNLPPYFRVIRHSIQDPMNPDKYIVLPLNGSVQIRFPWGAGEQRLRILMATTRGTFVSVQTIKVLPGMGEMPRAAKEDEPEHQLLTSDIAFQGYDESAPSISHADYHIYYHYKSSMLLEAEKVLKKPIVILDGFDPQDERNYEDLYEKKLVYGSQKLGDELRKKGYDVVILNFPITCSTEEEIQKKTKIKIPEVSGFTRRDGGTDYIERNAFLLVKLIQTLNAKLAQNGSAEKLVIVGPSMGGQISRYALAYMEKQGMDHRTRIWLSFDSPHLGANIALALQANLYFFGKFGGQHAALDAYNTQLYTPASRQMLIEQLDGNNGNAYFHWRYYNALNSNGLPGSGGWPQKVDKKLALVNGAGNGATVGYPCEEFLYLYAKTRTWIKIPVAEMKNNFMPSTGSNCVYINTWIPKLDNPLPIPYAKWDITNYNPHGSMDVVPGGVYDVQNEVKEKFEKALNEVRLTRWNWKLVQEWRIKHNQCFIPTVSALALKDNNFQWNMPLTEELIKQKGIPFDSYYIPSENQEHVSLTQKNVEWLMKQLDGIYYSEVQRMKLNGPSLVCETGIYKVEYMPSNATVLWTCSPVLQLSSVADKTATFSSSGNGMGWVQAQIAVNGVIINTLKQNVWLGKPAQVSQINGFMYHVKGGYEIPCSLNIPKEQEANYYSWGVSGGARIVSGQGTNTATIYVGSTFEDDESGYQPTSYHVGVTYGNDCGTKYIGEEGEIFVPAHPKAPQYTLYPNPATNTATLKIAKNDNNAAARSSANQAQQESIQTLTLTDMMGNVVRRNKYAAGTKSVEINVAGLPKGIYIVAVNEQNQNQQTLKLAVE